MNAFPDIDMDNWLDIDTIPVGRSVFVVSVKGLVCMARVRNSPPIFKGPDNWGPRRVACIRTDIKGANDIAAVRWKETDKSGTE